MLEELGKGIFWRNKPTWDRVKLLIKYGLDYVVYKPDFTQFSSITIRELRFYLNGLLHLGECAPTVAEWLKFADSRIIL